MQISDHRKIIEMLRLLQFHGIGRCGAAHGRAALSDDYAYSVGIIRHEESGVKLHIERIRSAVLWFRKRAHSLQEDCRSCSSTGGIRLSPRCPESPLRRHDCPSVVVKRNVKRHAFCAVIICVFIDYGYRRLGKKLT